jgi:hypothetical protein
MAPPRKKNTPTDPVDTKLDEIARLLAILVSRDRSLQDAVADLSAVGFGPTRIAELIGTSPGYAKVAIDRAKKKAAGKKAAAAAGE